MNQIKKFYCGRCKVKKYMTRKGLRKHLREEHLIKRKLANFEDAKTLEKVNQPWWKYE